MIPPDHPQPRSITDRTARRPSPQRPPEQLYGEDSDWPVWLFMVVGILIATVFAAYIWLPM